VKKILHVSDFHVGYRNIDQRFWAMINKLCSGSVCTPSETILLITGDLVDNAKTLQGYQVVINGINMLKEHGFRYILLVPGNHDYGTGSRGDKKYAVLFQEAFFGEKRRYPLVDIIDDIAFIGLDSMAAELHWYDHLWAEGEIGSKQLARLTDVLKSDRVISCGKRVIYLHHHPFDWRPLHQLKDSQKLFKVLDSVMKQGIFIDAILYGHNHEGHSRNGFWGIPRCYDAGSATLKPRSRIKRRIPGFGEVNNASRLIDLNGKPSSDIIVDFS